MRKIHIFIICIFFCTIHQNILAQKILFGAKGGLNFANITGEDSDEYANIKFGWCFGGFVDYKLNSFLSLRPELNYTERGCYFEEALGTITTLITKKYNYHYNYLEIPILLKMTVGNQVKMSVFGGPYAAFLLSARIRGKRKMEERTLTISHVILSETINQNIEAETNFFDTGFSFGTGFVLQKSATLSLMIDLCYTVGFRSIDKNNPQLDIRHEAMAMNAGFIFKI